MKNTLNGINGIVDAAEEEISEFEGTTVKTTQNEANREEMSEKSARINELWNFKRPNI